MANNAFTQPNKLLELTLRDGLDGLEDFTLQMAYANTGEQFEILPVDDSAKNPMMASSNEEQSKLRIVNTPVAAHATRAKRRA